MTKRHVQQTHNQKLGKFFTKNANELLTNYTQYIQHKDVIDPFAGDCDLLDWARNANANTVEGYDIEPVHDNVIKQDTLRQPPAWQNKFLLTNPPYLCSTKNTDKAIYRQWGQNDLYKCHIASFVDTLDEGILILPSNFLSERNAKARTLFFTHYTITNCDYYYYQVFPSATTGIVIFHFRRRKSAENVKFNCNIHYSKHDIQQMYVELEEKYGWLHGKDFFDFIAGYEKYTSRIWTGAEKGYLSQIVVGLLDAGKWQQGFSINEGEAICCRPTQFTTYQMVLHYEVTLENQRKIAQLANQKLQEYRKKYHGLFFSNYMGANQKIYSRAMLNQLFWKCHNIICGNTLQLDFSGEWPPKQKQT